MLENLLVNPNYEIRYLCDVNESHAKSIKERYNLAAEAVGKDCFTRVFGDEKVDCVIVGTPTDTHEGLCEQALKNGKHVFCEKPLAMTLESSLKIIELAKVRFLHEEKTVKILSGKESDSACRVQPPLRPSDSPRQERVKSSW